jgi:hypothetical protein
MQKPDSERPDKMCKQVRKEIAQLQFLSQEPGLLIKVPSFTKMAIGKSTGN